MPIKVNQTLNDGHGHSPFAHPTITVLLVEAIALSNNLTLVTHNIREFERVEGLQIEDWESPNP